MRIGQVGIEWDMYSGKGFVDRTLDFVMGLDREVGSLRS